MKRGVPPTAPYARTGELTPPGVTASARAKSASEAGTRSAVTPSSLSGHGPRPDRTSTDVRDRDLTALYAWAEPGQADPRAEVRHGNRGRAYRGHRAARARGVGHAARLDPADAAPMDLDRRRERVVRVLPPVAARAGDRAHGARRAPRGGVLLGRTHVRAWPPGPMA